MTNQFRTEVEELDAAARAIGRKLEDIKVEDRPTAPKGLRYCATWGAWDLDCPIGHGATPQEAMHDLIVFSDPVILRIKVPGGTIEIG